MSVLGIYCDALIKYAAKFYLTSLFLYIKIYIKEDIRQNGKTRFFFFFLGGVGFLCVCAFCCCFCFVWHRRRTFLLCKETGMKKCAGMLVETGKAFVDPSVMITQMREDSDFWSLPPLTIVLVNTFGQHKASRRHGIAQMDNQINYILVWKRFRSGVNSPRTRSFPGAGIGSDHDLLMTFRLRLEKKINRPKHTRLKSDLGKLKNPNVLETFQAMIGGKFAPLTIMSNNDTDINSMITTFNTADSWQTSSEEKKLGHCRNSWYVRQKERTEKEQIWAWRIWEIQGSEHYHQEEHEKG